MSNIRDHTAIAATRVVIVTGITLFDAEDTLLSIQNDQDNKVEDQLGYVVEVQGSWQHRPALYALAEGTFIPGKHCKAYKKSY